MEYLNNEIDTFKEQLSEADKTLVSNNELIKSSKYPFNKYANIFSVLLTKGNLSYDQYITLRDSYFSRNRRNRQTLWGGCTDANPKLLLNDI